MIALAQDTKQIEVYRNKPQLIMSAANTRYKIIKGGRRLGKTTGMVAPTLKHNMESMPGSSGFFAGKSYRKILDHLLPEVISGWKMLGWVEDEDFVVCKTPPKSWLKNTIVRPRTFDHFITAKNGSGIHLISFDHSSSSNGLSMDHGAIDEAKQLDPVRVDSELLKTMSGHASIVNEDGTCWRDLPGHTGLIITQDSYYGKRDFRWIDRYADSATAYKDLLEIILLQMKLQKDFNMPLQRYIWKKQREATMFLTPSTLENLAFLGIDYFKNAYRNSSLIEFRTSILNEDVPEIENGFYTYLDESIHGYSDKSNYSRIETIGLDRYRAGKGRDCQLDKDWRADLPLRIGLDYGTTWNWMLVMQLYGHVYWGLKNFTAQSPSKLEDLVREFCAYYKPHVHRVIYIYDDPSGHREKTNTTESDIETVITILVANDWEVIRGNDHNAYIPHKTKYRIVNYVLDSRDERDERFPTFQINQNNCYETLWSMSKAPIKQGQKDFEKDKTSETNLPADEQWRATHLSDCFDMIVGYECEHLLDGDDITFSI
ncbi:MAG: hypothetical protein JWO03_2859 [Bacteroidetes bacterium]|nr:hypothetical protein [Bacteroidota bacterium]